MYDYLKLDCQGAFWRYWIDNPLLDFPLEINERTGEVLESTRTAKLHNIEFKIIPSEANKGFYHCQITGSIHKFNNQGRHNADDFKFTEFITTIHQIVTNFDAKPEKTIVKSFEFGVNVHLPAHITCKQVIDSLVSMPTKRFARMNMKKVKLGKMVSFTDHDLKIYDKSGQISEHELFNRKNKIESNILRVEIRVNKTRFLEQKRLGLKQQGKPLLLGDIMQRSFAEAMGRVLLDMLNQIIYFEKLDTRNLTRNQEKKLTLFMSGNYWENLNNQQRYRAKQQFDELLQKCKHSQLSAELLQLTSAKITEMLADTCKNGIQKHQHLEPQKATNVPSKCSGQMSPPGKKQKPPKQKRYCATCGRDITHQRKGSKYCSEKIYGAAGKHCRNKAQYTKRAKKAKPAIANELKQLEKLYTKTPPKKLTITLNTGEVKRILTIELLIMSWSTRRKIITIQSVHLHLTRSRAKKYVKFLKYNLW